MFYDRIGADATTTSTFRKTKKMGFASNIREKVNRPSTASLFSNNEQSRIGSKIVLNKADNVGKNHHIHNDDYNDCLFSSKTIQEKSKMKNEKMKAKHFDISEKRKQVISFPNEELSIQHNVTEKLFNNWTGMEDRMAINRNRNLGDKNHYNRPDMRRPWTTHSMAIPHTSQSPSYKERSLGKKYSSGKERSFQRSCDVTRDAEFHQLSKTLFESNNKINSSSNLRANISAGSVHNETKSDNKSITDHGDGNLNQIHRNGDYETITLFQSTNSQKLRDNLAHGVLIIFIVADVIVVTIVNHTYLFVHSFITW